MASVIYPNKPSQSEGNYIVHPKKFAMWLFLVTITMLFAAFTSAVIVRRADGNWQSFEIPSSFFLSTLLSILSSLAMIYSYRMAKSDKIFNLRAGLWISFILGISFVTSQYIGFTQLVEAKVFLTGNPSGSFFYVITGLHALHVFGGVVFILSVLIQSYKWKVHSRKLLSINLCATYWHFIGALWVYLFFVLTYFVKN